MRRSRRRSPARILVLPRAQVLQRVLAVATRRGRDVRTILAHRLPFQIPFFLGRTDWIWRFTGIAPTGRPLVRADLVEKDRMAAFLATRGVEEGVRGVVVEDDFVAWLESRGDEVAAQSVGARCRLYAHRDRMIVALLHGSSCIASNQIRVEDAEEVRADPRAAFGDLIEATELDGIEVAPLPASDPAPHPLLSLGPQHRLTIEELPGGGWLVSLPDRQAADLLGGSRNAVRLLPDAWRIRRIGRERMRRVAMGTLLLLVAGVGISEGLRLLAERHGGERAAIEERRSLLLDDVNEVRAARELLERSGAQTGRGRRILEVWDLVAQKAPPGVLLLSFSIDQDGVVLLRGFAPDRETILSFMAQLRSGDAPLLSQITLGGLEDQEGEQTFSLVARVEYGVSSATDHPLEGASAVEAAGVSQ